MITRIDKPEMFVGYLLAAAERVIKEHGYESLVVAKMTEKGLATMCSKPPGGYDPLRVLLTVDNDFVTKAEIG